MSEKLTPEDDAALERLFATSKPRHLEPGWDVGLRKAIAESQVDHSPIAGGSNEADPDTSALLDVDADLIDLTHHDHRHNTDDTIKKRTFGNRLRQASGSYQRTILSAAAALLVGGIALMSVLSGTDLLPNLETGGSTTIDSTTNDGDDDVQALTSELAGLNEERDSLESERSELQDQIAVAQIEAEDARAAYTEEVVAGCDNSDDDSCQPGEGPRARAKQIEAEQREATADRITSTNQPRIAVIDERLAEIADQTQAITVPP